MNAVLHNKATIKIMAGNTFSDPQFIKNEDVSELERFDYIVAIIWSPELYKNNMVTHSFPCLLSSYLLRNVKIAQREL